jgi:hypothetical protein
MNGNAAKEIINGLEKSGSTLFARVFPQTQKCVSALGVLEDPGHASNRDLRFTQYSCGFARAVLFAKFARCPAYPQCLYGSAKDRG